MKVQRPKNSGDVGEMQLNRKDVVFINDRDFNEIYRHRLNVSRKHFWGNLETSGMLKT